MHKPIKYFERALSIAADGAWQLYRLANKAIPENPSFTPNWSDKPLLKSYQKMCIRDRFSADVCLSFSVRLPSAA